MTGAPKRVMRLRALAKINLFLHINGRRGDGRHQLQTAFQFLDRGDNVTVRLRGDRRIHSRGEPPGALALRAARLLQAATGGTQGAEIEIVKRLPIGGGLGGGSSDAAAVLIALNLLWKTQLGPAAIARLGARLGADVPLFVYGRAAWGEGVGDLLWPMDFEERRWLVAVPPRGVATAAVFAHPQLRRDTPPLQIDAAVAERAHNDCETAVAALRGDIIATLSSLRLKAPTARLSGSGGCLIAPVDGTVNTRSLARTLPTDWSWFSANSRNRAAWPRSAL